MDDIAKYFKVFSDPVRLEVIQLINRCESCSCNMVDKLPITQPTLSYHLKHISKAGLATTKREGNWIKYHLDITKVDQMIDFLTNLKKEHGENKGCKL